MNEENQSRMRDIDPSDDFQQIKGIGSSIAQALKEAGIQTFPDLAAKEPGQLADLLKGKVAFISPQRIERDDWIGQAQLLAQAEIQRESTPPSMNNDEVTQPTESESVPENVVTHNTWREIADFFVSFGYLLDREGGEIIQTKAHHSQTAQENVWEGIDLEHLTDWMLRQTNLPLPEETASDASGEGFEGLQNSPEEEQEVRLELTDLWVSEVASVTTSGQAKGRQLSARSKLNLSGASAMELTQAETPFEIEIHLVDSSTKMSILAASNPDRLIPGVVNYDILNHFRIPPAGQYQLYLFARLLPPWSVVTHLQGPMIHVNP